MPKLHILPSDISCDVEKGTNLLEALRAAGIFLDAPCGGNGRCGKCTVTADGQEVLACQTIVENDMQVLIPDGKGLYVMQSGIDTDIQMDPVRPGPLLAIDIGTTSVVCFLLDGTDGRELATSSSLNPQTAFGADVISRIRAAMSDQLDQERDLIRQELTRLITDVCSKTDTDPAGIGVVSVVGNPAMQQLFLGIMP
ncbi:MAG: 2Fe-2S iron-sulfur cluster binding domain-containing protein, partial [Oscillospiraceae bacterium]|nr:2Fe-2S iron-sulfur cluster binding domain-containing protein [Oscillospiraceae bacterium]